ncbi:pimeloyl-[acyl-carrier protein] methyl ester esterase [Acinetobacter sp. DSM 11652]|nr:hydrolase [Acinetobacter sp. Ver3]SEL99827.1 pimeloyl-[acyl-carrier protein] methyl ester esterase [Acinetobacter sp. DSM 11652]
MSKILLITGWGLGTKPLENLKTALDMAGFQIDLINIFNALDPVELSKHVELAKKVDVIIGWSLGGQLATLLTQKVFELSGQAKTLITLASNPCFVANERWSTGMPLSTFQSFRESFENDPMTTLKRFCYLVSQGSQTAKQDWQSLQNSITSEELDLKKQGLDLLYHLNTVEILKNYVGKQLHVFADDDGLVSNKVLDNIRKIDAKFFKFEIIPGSHCFSIFRATQLSDKIVQYLRKNEKS